jgi:hypothetical protein
MVDKYLSEHIQELASRDSSAFYLLLALEGNPSADDKCFASLAHVVDRMIVHEIALKKEARSELVEFLRTQNKQLAELLDGLDKGFVAAEPSRSAMRMVLTSYAGWVHEVASEEPQHLSKLLVLIGPAIPELKEEGVEAMIGILKGCSSDQARAVLLERVLVYAMTSGEVILAAARITDAALKSGEADVAERMVSVLNPDKLMETKDGRSLLPAIAAIGEDSDAISAALAAGLCFTIASDNFSSASHAAKKLKSLPEMRADVRHAYLRAFERIIREVGVSMVGFGLEKLPGRYQKNAERTQTFVEQGLSVAKRYGRFAADEFFQQKTAVSRQVGQ